MRLKIGNSLLKSYLLSGIVLFFVLISSTTLFGQQNKELPPITPYWSLGHIVWEDNINTEKGADSLIAGYVNHNIPVDGIIIDSPWEKHYNDFVWEPAWYSNPDSMLEVFTSKGVRTLLWMTGNINKTAKDIKNQKSPGFDFALENQYVIKVNGSAVFSWWKGEGAFIDFTNPKAVKWWNSKLDNVFKKGVYGWKVDNFRLPEGTDSLKSSIGMLSERDFKKYYYNFMYDYTLARNPEGIILARPYSHQGGYNATVSKLSVGWCGDFTGDWKGLKLQINNIYQSAETGYAALACEIGGFSGAASNKEQLIRYSQFASMVATMDNGGVNGAFENHLPWFHSEKATEIYRGLINMHRAIRPYIFSTLVDAHLGNGNLINNISQTEESHKLGTDLFTKAITSDTTEVSFQLPGENIWYSWWNGKKYDGGDAVTSDCLLDEFPLFISDGAIVPLDVNGMDCGIFKGFGDKTVVLIYGLGDREFTYHKPTGDGIAYYDIKISTKSDGTISVKSPHKEKFVFIVKKAGTPVVEKTSFGCGFDVVTGSQIISKKGARFSFKTDNQN